MSIYIKVSFLIIFVVLGSCSLKVDFFAGKTDNLKSQYSSTNNKIHHVVLLKLNQRSDYEKIVKDANSVLRAIPTANNLFIGKHVETERNEINDDYDCAIVMDFVDEISYMEYLKHPSHIQFVDEWSTKCKSITIYDISIN